MLEASVLWEMSARSYLLAPDHDRSDVVHLQGYNSRTATCRPPEKQRKAVTSRLERRTQATLHRLTKRLGFAQ